MDASAGTALEADEVAGPVCRDWRFPRGKRPARNRLRESRRPNPLSSKATSASNGLRGNPLVKPGCWRNSQARVTTMRCWCWDMRMLDGSCVPDAAESPATVSCESLVPLSSGYSNDGSEVASCFVAAEFHRRCVVVVVVVRKRKTRGAGTIAILPSRT